MSERWSPDYIAENFVPEPKYLTLEQHRAFKAAERTKAQAAARQRRFDAYQPPADPNYIPQSAPIGERPAPERQRLSRPLRVMRAALGVLTVGGMVSGGAYALNVGDIQTILHFGKTPQVTDGLTLQAPRTLSEKSLAPEQCKDPNAVFMVATVEGYWPLVPKLATTNNTSIVGPYLTEANKKSLKTKSQQSAFETLITNDGYPHATLENLPLALTICEPVPPSNQPDSMKAIKTQPDGTLVIDRSLLEVSFEDPYRLFDIKKYDVHLQVSGAKDTQTDPTKLQYMTLPNQSVLAPNSDAVYNKSISALATAMTTPEQTQLILTTMEKQVVAQLDNVVNPPKNVTYPESTEKSLQKTIDDALIQRLVGSTTKYTISGNYKMLVDEPIDQASKQPITTKNSLVGLDPTQEFHISDITIKVGSLKPPAATPSPTPTPIETNAP